MVNPKVWGSDAWYFIHSLAQNFRPGQIDKYRKLLRALKFVLPCQICRRNYQRDLRTNPITKIVDKASFQKWALKMYNLTNQKLGAPTISSYNLPERYRHDRILRFLRIMRRDALKSGRGNRIQAINQIRRNLILIIPCLVCRERLRAANVKSWPQFFKVVTRSH